MRYTISYDLLKPGRDYQTLYKALDAIGAQKMMLSERVISRTGTSAAGLRDYLWQYMDANDRIMVTCLDSNDWAGRNLMFNPNSLRNAA